MVLNQLIMCDLCGEMINLRSQIGFYDIPFNICCPKCLSSISGKLIIDQVGVGTRLLLTNAHEINFEKLDENKPCFFVELSAEFPTRKMHLRKLSDHVPTPFLTHFQFFNDNETAHNATSQAARFSNFIKNDWVKIKSYFELFWNKQFALLYPRIQEEISRLDKTKYSKVINELDLVLALEFLLITSSDVCLVLDHDTLAEYSNITKMIAENGNLDQEITILAQKAFLHSNDIERRAFKLIERFIQVYDQLIPVIALKNTNSVGNVNLEQFGIMTANFEELTDFYANCYEWILDNVDIIIGLNNIFTRGNYNDCANGDKIEDVIKIGSKFKKLDYIIESEPFSKPTFSLKNKIRNAIQHFNCEIDNVSQKITFTDKHAGKSNKVEMFLLDFAVLCLENFSIVFYLLELNFQLRQATYTSNGLKRNFYIMQIEDGELQGGGKKIGRNLKCPCGSGRKYKFCCGKNH